MAKRYPTTSTVTGDAIAKHRVHETVRAADTLGDHDRGVVVAVLMEKMDETARDALLVDLNAEWGD